MAHTITGIDIGAHAVKFVLVELGFRQSRVMSTLAIPVDAGEAPLFERQSEALRMGLDQLGSEVSTIYMALPGESLAVRVLELPFSDPRKIEQVAGYELEAQIVHSLQEVVFDHSILPPLGEGSSVLAVAARTEEVGSFLEAMTALGCEPRALYAAPVIYPAVSAGPAREAYPSSCRMLLDIGHRRTNICFVAGGKCLFARTLTRGGALLTGVVAQALGCGEEEAERAKHEHGFVSSSRRSAEGLIARKIDGPLRDAMGPWIRDLRQTLASVRAKVKLPVDSLLLTGGGSALGGLADYLEDELELPVSFWDAQVAPGDGRDRREPDIDPDDLDVMEEKEAAEGAEFALAAAIAWAGARGGKQIDLRRGPYLYRASFSLVRQKAAHLAGLAAALLICATVDGTMALARLGSQQEQLTSQLKTATQELFGVPRMDAKSVTNELKKSFRDDMAPIPRATAFDLVDQISRHMPPADRIKLDVLEIDIRPKKVSINGTIDSAAAVDEIVAKLGEIDCFEEITKGPITESSGAKKFALTIASKCP